MYFHVLPLIIYLMMHHHHPVHAKIITDFITEFTRFQIEKFTTFLHLLFARSCAFLNFLMLSQQVPLLCQSHNSQCEPVAQLP